MTLISHENYLDAARAGLLDLAAPATRNIKADIARAALAAGLTYGRAKRIWYGEARRVEPDEFDRITAALHARREKEARRDLDSLRALLAQMSTLLNQIDADFYGADIDRARLLVRAMELPARAVDHATGRGE